MCQGCKSLLTILQAMPVHVSMALTDCCWPQKPVLTAQVPDYNIYVAKEDEMCFEVIERKLKEAQYSSASEFLTDIDQIVSNAVAYNSQYCGDQGHQGASPCTLHCCKC